MSESTVGHDVAAGACRNEAAKTTCARRRVPLNRRVSLLAGLALLALVYHGIGNFILFTGHPFTPISKKTGGASDLRYRWLESQTIWRGHAAALNQGQLVEVEDDIRDLKQADGSLQPRAKVPFIGGYPPWAFFLGAFVLWGDWDTSRVLFGILNVAATIVLAYWAWQTGRRVDLPTARLSLLAALALSAHLNILVRGQMGTLAVAAVILAGWMFEQRRYFASGVSLSLAMAKPTIGFAFLIHFVSRGAWLPLVAMALVLGFGSVVILSLSGCSLAQVLEGLEGAGTHAFRRVPNAEFLLTESGIDPRWAVITLGLLGVALVWLLMDRYARGAWLEQLAIASVIGRLAAYHRAVDNVMVVFLLVLLAIRVGEEPRNRWLASLFLAVGISLWVPVRADWATPQVFSFVVWPAALAAVLIHQDKRKQPRISLTEP